MRDGPGRRRSGGAAVGLGLGVAAVVCAAVAARGAEPAGAEAADDLTFRPTVIVRRGNGQGSGTLIASVAGESLVLTAAHVVREAGPIAVELHRYNMGVEQALPPGGWPVTLPAEVAAVDRAADVAVVRVRGRPALPYVARLAAAGDEPGRNAGVVSVGIDRGTALKSWSTRVRGVTWLALAPDGRDPTVLRPVRTRTRTRTRPDRVEPDAGERPFLVTARAPEHGRSGGGLFQEGGRRALVGVCVGRVEASRGEVVGLFASGESVRRLLREHDLDAVVDRSEADRDRLKVTPTRAP